MGYKNIVITGASSGIGRATAVALAKQGTSLLLCGRTMEALEITIRECEKQQAHCIPYLYDICQPDAISAFIDTAVNELGRIDALINCASIYQKDGVDQLTAGLWDQVMDTNLKYTFFLTQQVLKNMKKNHYGYIVFINSTVAFGAVRLSSVCSPKTSQIVWLFYCRLHHEW